MKYQVILADPPWKIKAGTPNLHARKQGNRDLVYPTLSVEQIKSIPVTNVIDDNCVLFLWTINHYIEQAYDISRAWGFKPSTMLVWCKSPKGRGLGGAFGISTEFLLFSTRGKVNSISRYWSTWFNAKRRKHSQKPELIYKIIESMFDGQKLELFAREKHIGWDVWGNEVESDIEL